MRKVHTIVNGQKFGKLTVVREVEPKIYRASYKILRASGKVYKADRTVLVRMYYCRCACGTETRTSRKSLLHDHVQSCGCERYKEMSLRPIGRRKFGESYTRFVFGYYKKNARVRKVDFELSLSDFLALITQACHYCGAPPAQGKNQKTVKQTTMFNGTILHNGIDRVNPKTGYVLSNCVPCCKTCNGMKYLQSVDCFKAQIIKLYKHWASIGF